ncbi:glycosyltransferase [Deinococcus maricopensis]|uniref:Glycosyl transferase group 1 n=1 Tax=Deinococcus maricopensis (strain DSM 21211 / LMG 22137 / NRRL B-23946 / LB-34) TaxID=709986 RepID=E8UC09_DEIML|nr:glycosyltransferase [Deinococcus maricopensis]ADV68598.1 glycosyl transferase group 1 [Deinococcus maricopensis DSM 21211]
MTSSHPLPPPPHTPPAPGRIAAVMDAYLPGRLAGGPVTTLANMTAALSGELDFLVITRNKDIDGQVYADLTPNTLIQTPHSHNLYLDDAHFTAAHIVQRALDLGAQYLYLNSFFSPTVIRLLLYLRRTRPPLKVVLAPRGEFSPGALQLKRAKKQLYLTFFRRLRLDRVVDVFQASAFLEECDIRRQLGPVHVQIAPDIPDAVDDTRAPRFTRGAVPRLVFLSRITPMKNLLYLLKLLAQWPTPLALDVYGPLEDRAYWEACRAAMRHLPEHVQVTYRGVVDHAEVHTVFGQYDGFLFPTQGENFGHVILEALGAGCPVVLSDQTPWQDLDAEGVGWVCDLHHPEQFLRALEALLATPDDALQARRDRCVAYARRTAHDPLVRASNLHLFPHALHRPTTELTTLQEEATCKI